MTYELPCHNCGTCHEKSDEDHTGLLEGASWMYQNLSKVIETLSDENELLRAKHERVLKALEKIGMPYEDGPGMFIARQLEDRQALAREALENLRKWKGAEEKPYGMKEDEA